jgi:LacI family transcriptional regulator
MAIAAIKKITESGLSVPRDISVIGFDDIPMASQINPPLTTVSAPINEIARLSFEMLNSLIKGEPVLNMHVALPCKLIRRSTTTESRHNFVAA